MTPALHDDLHRLRNSASTVGLGVHADTATLQRGETSALRTGRLPDKAVDRP